MRLAALLLTLFVAEMGGMGQVRRSTAAEGEPQRTLETASPGAPANPTQLSVAEEASIRSTMDAYRRAWERMSDRMRKVVVTRGGQTPDQYERTLRQRLASMRQTPASSGAKAFAVPGPPAGNPVVSSPGGAQTNSGRQLNVDVLNSMKTSGEDLNVIRDANLQRVQPGGCSPEIGLRSAELRNRLDSLENGNGGERVNAPASRPGSAATLADDWFKTSATSRPAEKAPEPATRELDSVLGTNTHEPAAVDRLSVKPADLAEVARIKAQLVSLAGACAPKR